MTQTGKRINAQIQITCILGVADNNVFGRHFNFSFLCASMYFKSNKISIYDKLIS